MKSFLRIAIVAILLAGGGFAAWYVFGQNKSEAAPQTTAVTRGDIEETVLASGALEANSVTSVGAQVSGRIETLHVKLGDAVKKGDLIAEIDSLDQENAVKSAEASLANITAQRQAKQAEVLQNGQALARSTQLLTQRLLSDADYQAAEATLAASEAQVASLEAQITQASLAVDSANLDLSRTKIEAPVDGTVVAVLVSEGQSVNASQTAPTIVKLADLDKMVIKAEISEADVTRVKDGQSAYFTILGEPNTRIEATLKSVDPAPDAIATADSGITSSENAIYYNGLFEVDNPDHKLRIAMTAQVTIVIQSVKDALLLPSAVLGNEGTGGKYTVQVYDPTTGETRPAEVGVGINTNISAEITDGLKEGDLVVTSGTTVKGATTTTSTRALGGPPAMGL